jgi:ectoine hydroxylase-related dioxygenase (phytanoyl-CoA dioxygenase family)
MNHYLEDYKKKGYVLIKGVIDSRLCEESKVSISKLKSKLTIPFSNEPYGFGDVRTIHPYSSIANNKFIHEIAETLISDKIKMSHFMLVNKAAWIGPEVEWHQEVFNLQIYAPGCDARKEWKNFLQVFIAIDQHDKINGCLKVFEGSHKEGILDYEDIVNINCSHKRRVTVDNLTKISKKYEIVDVEMEPGDALFFNHLLVHGSPSNLSAYSRLSALMQFYKKDLSFKTKLFDEYSNFRASFVKSWLDSSLKKIEEYKKNLEDYKK